MREGWSNNNNEQSPVVVVHPLTFVCPIHCGCQNTYSLLWADFYPMCQEVHEVYNLSILPPAPKKHSSSVQVVSEVGFHRAEGHMCLGGSQL